MRQSAILMAGSLIVTICLTAFRLIATRSLGASEYGVLAALLTPGAVIAAAATSASAMVARLMAEAHAKGNDRRIARLHRLVPVFSIATLLLGVAVAVLFRGTLSTFLKVDDGVAVMASVVSATAILSAALLRGLLQGAQRFGRLALSHIADGLGKALLGSAAILIGLGASGGMMAFACAALGAGVLTYFLGRSATFDDRLKDEVSENAVARGAWTIAAFLLLASLIQVDSFLARHYLTPHLAGLYAAAVLPGRAVATLMTFLGTMMLPKATHHATRGTSGSGLLARILLLGGGISILAIAAFWTFPAEILAFAAGSHYGAAQSIIFPAGLAGVLWGITNIIVAYQIGFGRFVFLIPLSVAAVGEIVGIAAFHRSGAEIVESFLYANTLAIISCFAVAGISRLTRTPARLGVS